jgi:hypothetical protein
MKTINIKGKEYVPVVERVKEFHKLHPQGEIKTEIVNEASSDTRIVVKATVSLGKERVKDGDKLYENSMYLTREFTGYSQAEWGKGTMGDVALEIAETSAVGRALGFANIGLVDGIATADEMRKVKKDILEDEEPF